MPEYIVYRDPSPSVQKWTIFSTEHIKLWVTPEGFQVEGTQGRILIKNDDYVIKDSCKEAMAFVQAEIEKVKPASAKKLGG